MGKEQFVWVVDCLLIVQRMLNFRSLDYIDIMFAI
jgi:hypothetical protein